MSGAEQTADIATAEMDEYVPRRRDWWGFWSVLIQQTQNALNDKMAQFFLVPLGAAMGVMVESKAGFLIALPFVLFAPLAGWVNDRFSKRTVVIGSAIFQFLVLLWITVEVLQHRIYGALFGFFLLAVQSAFFSPAKIGLNKELLGARHIGMASALQQATSMLAILTGQIAAGIIFDQRWHALGGAQEKAWEAAQWPLTILTIASIPAVFMGFMIPPLKAHRQERFHASILIGHFRDLRTLWQDRLLRVGSFGVAFFWGFASFVNLWSLKLARELTAGGEGFGTLSSLFMAAASLGMALGFVAASILQRRRIQLGWVPIAAFLMMALMLILAAIPYGTSQGHLDLMHQFITTQTLPWGKELLFLMVLSLLSFCAALFLAPLNAWVQNRYPADKRGELQSAVNLQDCLAGIVAILVIVVVSEISSSMNGTGIDAIRFQAVVVALLCLVAALQALRYQAAECLRVLVLPIIRTIYRLRVIGGENIPAKGGVLLLPNHVTWADSFFISASCYRPVRFVMFDGFMSAKGVGWFARLFDTVPISSSRAKDAVRVVSDSLRAGHVVCLFAEGELTRTGTLQEIKRGFELMARRAEVPVLPVWVDGAWGSVFSFERGKFFNKIPYHLPYPLTAVYGTSLTSTVVTAEQLRLSLHEASAQALQHRAKKWIRRKKEQAAIWINGSQIGQVNAMPRRADLGMWEHDPTAQKLRSIHTGFAGIYGNTVHMTAADVLQASIRIGGKATRELLIEAGADAAEGVFYDFEYQKVSMPPQILHLPCYEIDGMVIALSMPDPPRGVATSNLQKGSQEGTMGLLLPGFYWRVAQHGIITLHGPALPKEGVCLPSGSSLDDRGFLTVG